MIEVSFTDLRKKLRSSSSSYQSKFLSQICEINFDHRHHHHILLSKSLSQTCERNFEHHHHHHISQSKFRSQILQCIRMGGFLPTYLLTYVLTEQADRGSVGGCCMDMWCPYGIGREIWDREVSLIDDHDPFP